MSDPSGQLLGERIMLTQTNVTQWKDAVINMALIMNAYKILVGTETLSTVGTDAMTMINFGARQSQLAVNIRSTLNETHRALIENATPEIAPNDAHGIWTFLVNHFEPKTPNSRVFAIQEMVLLRKGSAGHENETYFAYGTRCVAHGNSLKNLLPASTTSTAESFGQGNDAPSNVAFTPSTFYEGFSARDLIDELTIAMIITGLSFGKKDRELQSTIVHVVGVESLTKILEALQNADRLRRI